MNKKEYGVKLNIDISKFKQGLEKAKTLAEESKKDIEEPLRKVKISRDSLEKEIKLKSNVKEIEKDFKELESVKKRIETGQIKITRGDIGDTGKAVGYEPTSEEDAFWKMFSNMKGPVEDVNISLEETKEETNDVANNIEKTTNNTKNLSNNVSNTTKNVRKLGNETQKIKVRSKSLQTNFSDLGNNITKSIRKAVSSIKKFSLSLLGIRGIYSVLTKSANAYMSQDEKLHTRLQANWIALGSIFAPIINTLITLFQKLVAYINLFVKTITGGKINLLSKAMALVEKNTNKTTKSVKSLNKQLGTLDEIENIGIDQNDGDENFDIADALNEINNMDLNPKITNFFDDLTKKAKEFAESNILQDIFKDFEKIITPTIKIGKNIANGLAESISKYLTQNKDRIKNSFKNIFEITAEDFNIKVALLNSLEDISEIFKGETATQIGANIIAMFTNPFMSVLELLADFSKDITNLFAKPIIDNTKKIKKTIKGTLKPIESITNTISTAYTYMGDTITKVYDEHISPFYEELSKGLSDTFGKFLDVYNKYFQPFVEDLAKDLKKLWDKDLKPLWDNITKLIEETSKKSEALWKNIIKPFIDWCVQYILPLLSPVLTFIKDTVINSIRTISGVISGVIQTLTGITQFITGIFTGNWRSAWEGVVSIFRGIITSLGYIFKSPINAIIDGINNFIKQLNKIKIPKWVPGVGGKKISIEPLRHLAKGNVAYEPTVAEFGEYAGARSNPEITAPQNMIRETLFEALTDAMPLMGNSGSGDTILYVNGRELARATYQDFQAESNRLGSSNIAIRRVS